MRRLAWSALFAAALWSLFGCSTPSDSGASNGESLALVGGTIYADPWGEPIRDGVIVVRDGVIAAVGRQALVEVPRTAEVLDCTGLVVTAGFWNSHVHLFEEEWEGAAEMPAERLAGLLQDRFTRFGFTSVFDLGSPWGNTRRITQRIESGEVHGPRIRTTGEPILAPGAMPEESFLRSLGYMPLDGREVVDAAGATAAAEELLARGVNGIKVHLQPPAAQAARLPEAAIRAAVDEARRLGRPVFVHPDKGSDVLASVRSGVDVIAHTTPASGPWDEGLLAAMAEGRVALTPTLTLWQSYLPGDPTAVGQLRAWSAAGGTVLFGTDLGAVGPDPTEEYALMAEAGVSFAQILASLTTLPAERFGEDARLGRVAPGLQADLVVLSGDPAEDIRSLARVRLTLRNGETVFSAAE